MKSYSYTQEKKKKVKQFQEISEESKTCHSFVTSRWTMISDPRVVVRVVGFWGGPKFEANVRRLNPSATGPQVATMQCLNYRREESKTICSLDF